MFRKTLLTTLLLALLSLPSFSQNIIYVKQDAQGIGTSWANATGDLQYALAKATSGTEIWIAEGIYTPVQCSSCSEDDRSISFVIPNGVKVYGGFKGGERRSSKRDWRKYPSTLSGNVGQHGSYDNSYTVVYTSNVNKKTVLDGLIIANGYANGSAPAGHPSRSGGGLYNDGSGIGNQSNPTIKNCLFLGNFAQEGGAVFNNGDHGDSSPAMVDCTFTNNKAQYGGGAIFNNGDHGSSNPAISYCQFVSNEAVFGAGIFTACSGNDLYPGISNCTFVNNKAQNGGGLFFLGLTESPKMRTSRFVNNQSNGNEDIFVMESMVIPSGLLADAPMSDDGEL